MTSLGLLGQLPLPPLSSLWGDGEAPLFTRCQRSNKVNAQVWLINGSMPQYHDKSILSLPRCRNLFCPYCHRERMEKQSASLKRALTAASQKRLGLSLLTLTIEHHIEQPLQSILKPIKQVYSKTRQSSPFERMKAQTGYLGVINVMEINHTQNGWNPHYHSIVFAKNKKGAIASSDFLGNRFSNFLERDGFLVNEKTYDSRLMYNPLRLSGYLSKSWFYDDKQSKSPFQLAGEGLQGNEQSARLFVECCNAMKGMKNAMVSSQLKASIKEN